MAGFSERSRVAQGAGYQKAVDQMIPALRAELEQFKERIKTDAAYKVENKPGYAEKIASKKRRRAAASKSGE